MFSSLHFCFINSRITTNRMRPTLLLPHDRQHTLSGEGIWRIAHVPFFANISYLAGILRLLLTFLRSL